MDIVTMIVGMIHVVVVTHYPTWSVISVMEREDGMSVSIVLAVQEEKRNVSRPWEKWNLFSIR